MPARIKSLQFLVLVAIIIFGVIGFTCQSLGQILDPDLNDDGIVNIFDLVIVGKSYGKNPGDPGYDPRADTDGDVDVDYDDLNFIRSNLGKTFPASQASDPDMIFEEDGVLYPLNELIVILAEGEPRATAEDIARSIGGKIVGFSPSTNAYQIKVITSTIEELDQLIDQLSNDPRIEGVCKNILLELSANTDLSHLREISPSATKAYDKIKIQEAWELVESFSPPLSKIKIGVVDTGIDLSHPEFEGVEIHRRFLVDDDTDGHGTSICGIIGANNISATKEYKPPQMNGIISGVTDNYILYVLNPGIIKIKPLDFEFISIMGILDAIDILASQEVKIINLSFDTKNLKWLGKIFEFLKLLFHRNFSKHSNITFIISAGNKNTNVEHVLPGGIELNNVITVGGTNLSDERWLSNEKGSNFGTTIDIAAPAELIYAPILYSAPLDPMDYDFFNGTSGAAPMVTGVAAILLAINPDLSARVIRGSGRSGDYPDNVKKVLGSLGN